MKNLTFNQFAEKYCDRLYSPKFNYENQSTGYRMLRKMIENRINPATKEECKRWETNPTVKELLESPDMKYLRFLHPNLRNFIRDEWETIKNLEL